MNIETVTDHKCLLGEGPVWDAKESQMYWLDIFRGEIFCYSLASRTLHSYPIGEMVGSMALCTDGSLIFASKSGFGFLNKVTGKIKMLAKPEDHLPNNRFNDGKCDPAGRFWAGTMSLSEEKGAGNLYVLERNQAHKKIENVTISNGLAWSLDYKTMYYIDTPTRKVVSFTFDKATGNISNRKIIIHIPKEDGYPDGMTIDTEGMLWIAHWDGWQVTRWHPVSGKKIHAIPLPAAKITSCTFGGNGLTDLYITSASVGLSPKELEKQPLAGSLFVIKNCGFQGMPTFEFVNGEVK